jgi:broad specificity phosphatase PhoE
MSARSGASSTGCTRSKGDALMMTTTFYLIRHAEKAVIGNVLAGRAAGVHLSEEGRWQCRQLTRRLAGESIHKILCSPQQRTHETVAALARQKGLNIETCADIDEIDFGAWTGKTVEELEPDAYWQQYNAFRSGLRIPGGERMLEVQTRFVATMLRLHEACPDQGIALVSHGDPIKLAIAYFAGVPLELFDRFEISPASVSTIALGPYGPKIFNLNDTCPALPDPAT